MAFSSIIFQLLSLLAFILFIVCLIDLLKRKWKTADKIIWLIFLLIAPLISSIIYYVVVIRKGK